MVEPRGIEPLSEIPTWIKHSYAIDDFPALLHSGHLRYRQICPRAYNSLHASTTLFRYPVIRKTAMIGRILNLRRLPDRRCVVLEIHYLSGSNPASHHGGKCGMDHYNSRIVVISFLFKPWGGLLPASLTLSEPRRTHYGPIWNCQGVPVRA